MRGRLEADKQGQGSCSPKEGKREGKASETHPLPGFAGWSPWSAGEGLTWPPWGNGIPVITSSDPGH